MTSDNLHPDLAKSAAFPACAFMTSETLICSRTHIDIDPATAASNGWSQLLSVLHSIISVATLVSLHLVTLVLTLFGGTNVWTVFSHMSRERGNVALKAVLELCYTAMYCSRHIARGSVGQRRTQGGEGLPGCSPSKPQKLKLKNHGFCRYYDLKSFM
jgi:hypothetical protein